MLFTQPCEKYRHVNICAATYIDYFNTDTLLYNNNEELKQITVSLDINMELQEKVESNERHEVLKELKMQEVIDNDERDQKCQNKNGNQGLQKSNESQGVRKRKDDNQSLKRSDGNQGVKNSEDGNQNEHGNNGLVSEEVQELTREGKGGRSNTGNNSGVLYTVEENPPWHLCILLGFQHYVTAVGDIISVPLMLAEFFCMDQDIVGVSELIGTILFVSGLSTLLQSTLGVRLPIIQGGTVTFVIPTFAIMMQPQWECPYKIARDQYGPNLNVSMLGLPEIGSDEHREMWMSRICEIQGAIIVASLFQVLTGASGILTYVLKYIGPLCIVPIITLTGISLFPVGSKMASGQWWIALLTMFLITLFSQYLNRVNVPCFTINKDKKCTKKEIPLFGLFPVLLGVITSFTVCAILTTTNVFPDDKTKWGNLARTDTNIHVLKESKWFRFPYPCQWGLPTVSIVGVFGMLAGVIAAMIESIGDYYACARLAGAPPPPLHAVNRGVFTEGVACVLAGLWGSGNGTTSYAENIGVIGLTKVGSRRVVQIGGLMMLVLGCFGKFAAIFTLIPTPVLGGMFMITFGMVTAVGLSNLQYVDLNSPRNLFILGISMFFGLSLPMWISEHDVINTGNDIIDQLFSVLLSTSMFVGGLVGFVLDNTIPGTDEERGIHSWRLGSGNSATVTSDSSQTTYDLYNFPYIQPYLDKIKLFAYVPVCPRFLAKPVTLERNCEDEPKEVET